MDKSEILRQLKSHLKSGVSGVNIDKKTAKVVAALEKATEGDISFGDNPQYFYARLNCNSTGVGVSSFENTKTQRTVAMDYTTEEFLFIDGHEGTAVKGLELFHLKPGETVNYYKKSKMADVAASCGAKLHLQQFKELNFIIKDHRVNRYTASITRGPFSAPICPVFVSVMDVDQPVFIGYVYQKDGKEYVLIELKDIRNAGKGKSVFSPWMLLSLIFPPLLLVSVVVILLRIKNSQE